VLELFRNAAHRLTLKEAIERGELVPIRCVRVKTNVDLTRVRFNEVQYNRQDLETTITVPARNDLIVQTYLDHVRGRKGVTFCVNVRHGETLAELYRQQGVPARSVSGGMPARERDEALAAFARGEVLMLCACDLLNEGWDCPDIEVLLMARPTLSKIIYMQQLGRGTRKAPGKESLLVFDFVDNAGRYNQSWDLHRLTGTRIYRPGRLVLAPEDRIADEEAHGPERPAGHRRRPLDRAPGRDRHLRLAERRQGHAHRRRAGTGPGRLRRLPPRQGPRRRPHRGPRPDHRQPPLPLLPQGPQAGDRRALRSSSPSPPPTSASASSPSARRWTWPPATSPSCCSACSMPSTTTAACRSTG
jgi:superfamily II DNA or RNA helicase